MITFVLVEPAVPGNVGAAARAMKTMGFSKLRLVKPCDHLSTEARMLAHGSNEILEGAEIFPVLSEALKDVDFVIGTTAKNRRVKHDFHTPVELPGIITSKKGWAGQTALVFGREESGLSNEEMQLCDILSTIPMKTSYPSLNLGQAVMLYAWELSGLKDEQAYSSNQQDSGSLRVLQQKVALMLKTFGIDDDGVIFPRIRERLMLLSDDDLHLLHSVHKAWESSEKKRLKR